MARNKLADLNNHLFSQLEKLTDDDLQDSDVELEIKKTKVINEIAKNIINNANTTIAVMKFKAEHLNRNEETDDILKVTSNVKTIN